MEQATQVIGLPPPRLRPLVNRYIGYHYRSAPGVHRGLPSSKLTFIATVTGTIDLRAPDGPPRRYAALVGGLHETPVTIEHDGRQHGIEADLTPLGARALFGLPAGELAGLDVHLGDLLGAPAAELLDRLRAAGTWTDRFACFTDILDRVARPAAIPAPELGWAWRRLTAAPAAVAVAELAAEVGWSRQHLRTRFQREFGVSPKVLARVVRFQHARDLLVRPDRPALAEIAARAGYADQAHFTRDWRAFSGLSPTVWLAEELPFAQDPDPDRPPA
ncbi:MULTISPECIES: helix-turn-helix domain-containing protein [unclassified Crossiella]|uniref:AraC family transcriptional regulator n=1 Tax=unclassified Crossiella TaxID=2620835 RepID=UPI001FFFDE6B|nr:MULTISPECIES: helix-turn-helix domain-containing protein [unclassified Crossiella]MCK2239544.1 helix-turn-helix domain-containing protein [Crossiella sp. S99.2]MCK2252239.1 helix-turn-helix domain-containing protein [Crossiella sp. S99.1]